MDSKQYVYVIRPIRSGFLEQMLDEEVAIMGQHFEYLQNLLHEGKLILAGPCLDRTFGIIILKADSQELAQEIMENDPSIKLGVMSGELHPYRVSLMAN